MMILRCIVALALAAHCVASMAQTTVYESKDKAGTVYSDRPSSAAAPVDLPPPNVIQSQKIEPAAPPPVTAAPAYRSLAIVSLANEATVHTNTGAFDFSARANPALRANDRMRVMLDGRLLPSSFRSTSLHVSESDWQGAASDESAAHTLQLAIVDKQGTVLIESAPVRFYVHRATVGRQRR